MIPALPLAPAVADLFNSRCQLPLHRLALPASSSQSNPLNFMPSSSPLQHYKDFVRKHPGLVQNGERLLHWLVWNPERFSGSE